MGAEIFVFIEFFNKKCSGHNKIWVALPLNTGLCWTLANIGRKDKITTSLRATPHERNASKTTHVSTKGKHDSNQHEADQWRAVRNRWWKPLFFG